MFKNCCIIIYSTCFNFKDCYNQINHFAIFVHNISCFLTIQHVYCTCVVEATFFANSFCYSNLILHTMEGNMNSYPDSYLLCIYNRLRLHFQFNFLKKRESKFWGWFLFFQWRFLLEMCGALTPKSYKPSQDLLKAPL